MRHKILYVGTGHLLILIVALALLGLPALVWAESPPPAAAEVAPPSAPAQGNPQGVWLGLAAMGAVGISCLSSAYALGKIGSAALGAMSEKPEVGGSALVFLGMAEGVAIYGLIVAIMILNKI